MLRKLYGLLTVIATVVTIMTPFSGLISQWLRDLSLHGWPLRTASWLADYGVPVLLVTGGILLGYAALRHWRLKSTWRMITRRHLAFVQQFAVFATETADYRESAARGSASDESWLALHLYNFLQNSLGHVAAVMEAYTGYPCHASIKSYRQDNETILTGARDPNNLDREASDDRLNEGFHYKDSTAFAKILDDRDCNAYVANDLVKRSTKGLYQNKNPRWQESYTATAIVPITLTRAAEKIEPKTVIGFLCVDNRKGGFDEGACVDLLATFARSYYFAMADHVRIAQAAHNVAESQGT